MFRKQWDGLGDARQAIDRFHVRGEQIITEGRLSRSLPGGGELENRVLLSWTVRDGRSTACRSSAPDRPSSRRWRPPDWVNEKPPFAGDSRDGRYWARTSDLQLVELALSQLS